MTATISENVFTHVYQGGNLNLTTSDGRLHARMGAAIAAHESEHKGDRIKSKWKQLAEQGRHAHGARPFGWDLERDDTDKAERLASRLVLNEREATELRKAIDGYLYEGRSLGAICRDWNDPEREGGPVLTTLGNRWTTDALRQVFVRPRNAGIATHQGMEVSRGKFEAIVSEAQLRAVQRKVKERAAPKGHTNKATHLLSGIALCPCGASLVAGARRQTRKGEHYWVPTYKCLPDRPRRGEGPHTNKQVDHLDDAVKIAVYEWFKHPYKFLPKVSPEDEARAAEIESERRELGHRRDNMAEALAAGTLDIAAYSAATTALSTRERELDEELEALGARMQAVPSPVEPQDVPRVAVDPFRLEQADRLYRDWLTWPLDDQRDFVRRHFRVQVLPTPKGAPRRFDPALVDIRLVNEGEPVGAHLGATHDAEDTDAGWPVSGDRLGVYEPAGDFRERRAEYERLAARLNGDDTPPASAKGSAPSARWEAGDGAEA